MEYCGFELTDEGLKHYGVKGMHWGIRRYQPYPREGGMTKRHARKAVRIINSNAKRNAIKRYYKDESVKAYQIHMQKAKEAMRDNKDKKASKQLKKAGKEMADIMTLDKQIKSGESEINKALKNLNENGYKTLGNTKIKRFADLGRTITDLFSPAGAIGVAQTQGPNGTQTGAGPAIIQRPYIKTKLQKAPKTDRVTKILEKNGDKMMTKALNSEKMNNRLNAIDQMMKKSKYAEEYERAKKGTEQIQKDYNLPTYEELRAKAAKQSSTNLVRGGRLVTIKQPKTVSSQDRIDDAYKKAESIRVGYGAGSVDMSHPAVKWAIEEAVKKGGNRESVTRFIEDEGEPPRHDDWAHVILDYEKSKKKK